MKQSYIKIRKFKEKYGCAAIAALLGVKDSRTVYGWIARGSVPESYSFQIKSMKDIHFKKLEELIYT